ncbi:class I tRNA ligase family protein [Nonomuraea sp. NPDC050691]|uniref:class I tRNA ligase family protein n=1 Tax=Nonomuraea sp. NPDC050691 TaxID=3155661 RepID=UPI0033EA478F
MREPRKVHLVGKGVIRFHAVYWPAMLLSAGLPLPSDIVVHDYLTAGGRKISKSSGVTVDPVALVRAYGADAVRWWLLREVPRVGDADFTEERLVARADEDLANGIGNLVNRVVTMVHRFQDGHVTRHAGPGSLGVTAGSGSPAVTAGLGSSAVTGERDAAVASAGRALATAPERSPATDSGRANAAEAGLALSEVVEAGRVLEEVVERAGRLVDEALADYDFRRATAAVQAIVEAANAYVERARPWRQPPAEREASLATLVAACRALAVQLEPFLPSAAARVAAAVDGERLPEPRPLFPRLGS